MSGASRMGLMAVVFGGLCFGQQFEVASVKPSGTPPHTAYVIDASRVDLGFASLKVLITMAYKLEAYRVDGPDWLATTRFDLLATLPAGSTKEQVPQMVQALLADRFKLKVHHEAKEQQVYALIVGKDGSKLKEGGSDNNDRSFLNGRRLMSRFDTAAGDGFWTISQLDGRYAFDASRITLRELANILSQYVEDPVVDMSGLTGAWQVRLDVPPASLRGARASAARDGVAPDPDGVSIVASVRKLGLELVHRKAPVDHLVVDSVEKVPTEN